MRRRALVVVAAVAVTIVFGAIAIRGAHPEEMWEAARESQPLWLVPSLALLAVSVWLRAVRWRALFAPSRRPALWPVTAATLVGYFFNQILPLRAGEPARVVALNQRSRISNAEIAGTAVLERVYDLVAVLVLLFVLLPWLPEITWIRAAATLAAVVGVLVAVAVASFAIWGERAAHVAVRPIGWLPFVDAAHLEEMGRNLAHGLVGLRDVGLAANAFALTLVSWVTLGLSTWFVFVAFDLGVPVAAGVFAMVAAGLTAVLPAGPSGIGVFEATIVVVLRAYDVDDSTALSSALVLHALQFVPFVIAGLAVLRFHVRAATGR